MKKVLIITYYWPPSGGIAVLRWLKFAKYLPDFNWQPVVVIPENPEYPVLDKNHMNEVSKNLEIIKIPIFEPHRFFSKIRGKNKKDKISAGFMSDSKKGLFDNLSIWIRSNIIIPDARRFWIKPVYKHVSKYLSENKVDYIITTGPPHSVHLAGLKLKKKFKSVKWLTDFRDPWTKIDFYDELKPMFFANRLHHQWEEKVVKTADIVVTVSDYNSRDYKKMGAKSIHTITNGYDTEDFTTEPVLLSEKFTIAHVGSFMANRNIKTLWSALNELVNEVEGFKSDLNLKFVGNIDYTIKKELDKFGLTSYSEFVGYVSHAEAIKHQKTSQVLLLVINKTGNPKGMVTGKIFDYLASGRQILLIGPEDGDAAKIISKTKSGLVADLSDKNRIKSVISEFYNAFKSGKDVTTGDQNEINKFSRKNLTKVLVNILNLKSLKNNPY